MLGDKKVITTIAVRDTRLAATFYEGVLGLKRLESMGDEAVVLQSAGAPLLIYRSQYAGTNQATAATWNLGSDFDSIVAGLQSKRVHFERYDNLPGLKRQGDVHTAGDRKMAWIRDPDGNILALDND
jgi:catechol 2,3-dioxygenase-like lactoylglutathione lyase family enzyme